VKKRGQKKNRKDKKIAVPFRTPPFMHSFFGMLIDDLFFPSGGANFLIFLIFF
jgi:hypothetical protein